MTNAVQRALQQGLPWPLPAELDEAGLEALLYRKVAPPAGTIEGDASTQPTRGMWSPPSPLDPPVPRLNHTFIRIP